MFAMQQFSGILPLKRAASFSNLKSLTAKDGAYYSRTQGTGTSRRVMTFSFWVYLPGDPDSRTEIINCDFIDFVRIPADRKIYLFFAEGADGLISSSSALSSGAWSHVVIQIDTTKSTLANGGKIFVNSSDVSSVDVTVTTNYDTRWGLSSADERVVNCQATTNVPIIDELAKIDGQIVAPSSFASAGKPINLSSLSFGSQGYWLRFETGLASSGGTDSSPNGLTFTNNSFVDGDFSSSVP